MQHRPATTEEVLADRSIKFSMERGRKVLFRHFMLELYAPNAKNGVQHREWSRSRLHHIDGKLFVRHHGKMQEVVGQLVTLDNGVTFIADLKLNNEYLK